jgi:hypothetical protein
MGKGGLCRMRWRGKSLEIETRVKEDSNVDVNCFGCWVL